MQTEKRRNKKNVPNNERFLIAAAAATTLTTHPKLVGLLRLSSSGYCCRQHTSHSIYFFGQIHRLPTDSRSFCWMERPPWHGIQRSEWKTCDDDRRKTVVVDIIDGRDAVCIAKKQFFLGFFSCSMLVKVVVFGAYEHVVRGYASEHQDDVCLIGNVRRRK